jgi:hypothetical protein
MRINQLSERNYIDAGKAEETTRGLIPPTPANLKRFVQFLKEKWTERSKQRHDSWGDAQADQWQPPSTLEGACKFTSLFALRLFGGRIRGNEHHQYLELPNGKIIDPVPVPDHDDPQYHDDDFWMNPEHKQSLESCLPRVKGWVNEFMSMNESQITEMADRSGLPDRASWYKGAFPFAALQDDNRRFMFNPSTGTFIIGEHDVLGKGDGVPESHDSEFNASGAPGSRHDYMVSGWIGIGGKYNNGVIHFAPPIFDMDMEDQAVKQAAMSAIEGFKKSGANKNTVLRNFGTRGERKLGTVTEAVITELTKGVKKGSQNREKIGFASDDPSKYVGKWEAYDEPQGINSPAGKKMTKTEGIGDGKYTQLYRGMNSGQEGNSYYTTDKEWARQFTQSGQDSEIKAVRYPTGRIFKNNPLPKAYGLDDDDIAIMDRAWDEGYKGVWMDEGQGQPDSVYFMRSRPSELTEGVNPNTSGSYEWVSPSTALFNVDGVMFRAMFGNWFAFDVAPEQDRPKNPSTGFTTKVFSTLVTMILDYLETRKPDRMAFVGGSKSRDSLYGRLVNLFKDRLPAGYVVTGNKANENSATEYTIQKVSGIKEGIVDGMKFYHGQPRPEGGQIEQFKLPRGDDGIYFSNNPDYAMGYATEFRAEKPDPSFDDFDKTGVTYPVYLDLKNPLILNGDDEAVFEKYTQRGFKRSEVMAQGYDGIILKYTDGEIEAQAYDPRQIRSAIGEGSLGPHPNSGMSNSSTGLGSTPPQIELNPSVWQRKTNGKQKMAGHKAPSVLVRRNVKKSTMNKNRKLNSEVTEVFGDSSNSFPYDFNSSGWIDIDVGIEGLEVVVGMEDIKNYNQSLPSGVNVGMVTQTEDGMHLGIEPAKVGMTTKDTIRLFNTLMNIVRQYVETNDPDRLYFVAVKPMEGIYQRLIRRFVNTDEWNIKVIKDVPIPMAGTNLNAYMIEKKNMVSETYREPKHKQLNTDYEVEDNGEMVAKASISDGVIDEFMIRDDVGNNDFRGKYMSGLMSAIVRDADMTNSNMSMQIPDQYDMEMKRFLERFGFKHVGDGVFRRTAGSLTPPSVIY